MKLLILCSAMTMAGSSFADSSNEEPSRNLRPITSDSEIGPDDFIVKNLHPCGTNQNDVPSDDMWLRFSKVSFPGEIPPGVNLPLLPSDFPICSTTASWLRQSTCWSVIMQEDCVECGGINIMQMAHKIGNLPTHPSWNNAHPFWDEFREVISARKARLRGDSAVSVLKRVPAIWEGFTLEQAAEAVHNEYPGKNQALLIEQFIGEGVQMDRDIVPSKNYIDFLRYEITLAELNTWAIAMVGPVNFGTKWSFGRARPEEVAWYITKHNSTAQELINRGIPADVVNDVLDMNLQTQVEFTAYPEGCPDHPSFPAMHSAASVVSFWLPLVMNVTADQICEAKALDWAVSFGRTIAGVHFSGDNTFGLNLGQEMLAMKLPNFLQSKFGADPNKVRAKMAKLRHDWRNYLDGDCFSGATSN